MKTKQSFKFMAACLIGLTLLQGCGKDAPSGSGPEIPPNVDVGPTQDGLVVRGIAIVNIQNTQETAFIKFLKSAGIPSAYAATGTSTVTYVNAAAVSFQISVLNLGANGFTGDTLSLGSVALSGLDDNSLKVCGVGGNQKCTQALIRVYTTGSIAGFVNTADGYGIPVNAGTLNPTQQVGLNSAGSVNVQTISIANNKNRLRLTDFPSPSYPVSADFSNGGAGTYNMTFVVEYALAP